MFISSKCEIVPGKLGKFDLNHSEKANDQGSVLLQVTTGFHHALAASVSQRAFSTESCPRTNPSGPRTSTPGFSGELTRYSSGRFVKIKKCLAPLFLQVSNLVEWRVERSVRGRPASHCEGPTGLCQRPTAKPVLARAARKGLR